VSARVLTLGLALVVLGGPAAMGDDPVTTDAPPPVPLGIIEGSAAPVAPLSPRRGARPAASRRRSPALRTTTAQPEKPMDRWARLPRPQRRSGGGSAFGLSNGSGHGSSSAATCSH